MRRIAHAPGVYRLAWVPRLQNLGYVLLAEVMLYWVLSFVPAGSVARGFLRLWWLWSGLTLLLGLIGFAATGVIPDGRGVSTVTLGLAWRSLPWVDVRGARLLKVGRTLAVVVATKEGRFRGWRQGTLLDADGLAAGMRQILAGRLSETLAPPYRTRRGLVWSVDADGIRVAREGAVVESFIPGTLQGIKFLFGEGGDLPLRTFLFPAGGGFARSAGHEVEFFVFLAADILRFARNHGIKVVCRELGKHRPRLFSRRNADAEGKAERPAAWEVEGY